MKTVLIISILSLLTISSYIYLSQTEVNSDDHISVLMVGDVGTGNENQWKVAEQMNVIGGENNSKFILSFGDNFYQDGLTDAGLQDPQWDEKYANIYPKMDYLKNLPWYGTIGNHDFRGAGLFTEFEYQKNNWQIEDFFWAHEDNVAGQRIAFIHIDTNFLAYGPEGESESMKNYFIELNWTSDEQMLAMTEEYLIKYQDYDWVMVMAHHHIGYSCPEQLNTGKLYDLLQRYKVDAYLNGHSHTLAFTIQEDMGMVVSGAGGKSRYNECEDANPMWSKGLIFGFVEAKIYDNKMVITAHYIGEDWAIDSSQKWQNLSFPPIRRRRN